MKTWSKPMVLNLNIRYTEAGMIGGAPDGVVFSGSKFISTSGADSEPDAPGRGRGRGRGRGKGRGRD